MPKGLEILAKARYGPDEYGCVLAHGHANTLGIAYHDYFRHCLHLHTLSHFPVYKTTHNTNPPIYRTAPNPQARLDDPTMAQDTSANQRNSPLLRLPAELRNQIYEYVLDVQRIRVFALPDKRLQRYHDEDAPRAAIKLLEV